MGNISTRNFNEKSFRGTKTHTTTHLDAHSFMKRHTVSQMSKLHQKLKKTRHPNLSYENAEVILDKRRQPKQEIGLTEKLVDAGFIEKQLPARNYEKHWNHRDHLKFEDSDSDHGSYHGIWAALNFNWLIMKVSFLKLK